MSDQEESGDLVPFIGGWGITHTYTHYSHLGLSHRTSCALSHLSSQQTYEEGIFIILNLQMRTRGVK